MAHYQILYWKHIPCQVKAFDESGEVNLRLPERFMTAIDALAMSEGITGTDAYLDAWQWGPMQHREGPAQEVAHALVAEIDAAYPRMKDILKSDS